MAEVVIPARDDVAVAFAKLCVDRGLAPQTLFEIMVRRFSLKEWLFGLQDRMPFGQYKGLLVEDIIRADARYIRWLCGESDKFELSYQAQQFMDDMYPEPE